MTKDEEQQVNALMEPLNETAYEVLVTAASAIMEKFDPDELDIQDVIEGLKVLVKVTELRARQDAQ